jgi:hypothetical protein
LSLFAKEGKIWYEQREYGLANHPLPFVKGE